jgi:hypothetical protein
LLPFQRFVRELTAKSDVAGVYRFEHVPAGAHYVALQLPPGKGGSARFTVNPIDVAEGEGSVLNLRMPADGD